ncbi:hypothetical protein D9619_002252 [Psilocybe cf. subviscida]|uniref:DUF5648 domain-containing protein n=1 Tax=Psilocybe cf. subviscida TaxID=2480587 RepID=A0A8H5BGP1_9AGAR|nr:hypothetical protein D9619_002252 [Psilocybe cf. subviscida]
MYLLSALSLTVALISSTFVAAAPNLEHRAVCGNITNAYNLRRMYSDTVKDHIYTISVFEEGGYLFAPQGYVAQTLNAALLFRFATDASSLVPLYHLYQSATQTNLYTSSASLRQTLLTVAQPPYTDATFPGSVGSIAIEAYVYPDGSCPGTVPLLWASNSLITDNYYTIDTAEYNSFVANGYTPMDPVGWVYPVPPDQEI